MFCKLVWHLTDLLLQLGNNLFLFHLAYKLNEKEIDYFPAAVEDQLNVKPVYKTFKGWKSKTQGIKKFEDLPNNAKIYVKAIEEFIETKISSISTSPERKDTILLVDPFYC